MKNKYFRNIYHLDAYRLLSVIGYVMFFSGFELMYKAVFVREAGAGVLYFLFEVLAFIIQGAILTVGAKETSSKGINLKTDELPAPKQPAYFFFCIGLALYMAIYIPFLIVCIYIFWEAIKG
jgi:hypothetical protein